MKKIFILTSLLMSFFCFNVEAKMPTGQKGLNKFECKYFTLEYPASFKKTTVIDSSHMEIALLSEDGYIGISVFDRPVSYNTAWDERFIKYCLGHLFLRYLGDVMDGNQDQQAYTIDSISKVLVETKNKSIKCLKWDVKISPPETSQSANLIVFTAINEEFLYVMPFLSTSHNYDASVLIKLMEGLSIGYQTNPKDAEYIKRYISKSIEEIKEIYPYKIDDCVTLTDTYLEDKVITIKLIVSDESKLLETYPNYMLKACEVISRTIAKRSVFFLSKYGYTVRCIITNNGGSVLYDNEIRSSYLNVF